MLPVRRRTVAQLLQARQKCDARCAVRDEQDEAVQQPQRERVCRGGDRGQALVLRRRQALVSERRLRSALACLYTVRLLQPPSYQTCMSCCMGSQCTGFQR